MSAQRIHALILTCIFAVIKVELHIIFIFNNKYNSGYADGERSGATASSYTLTCTLFGVRWKGAYVKVTNLTGSIIFDKRARYDTLSLNDGSRYYKHTYNCDLSKNLTYRADYELTTFRDNNVDLLGMLN